MASLAQLHNRAKPTRQYNDYEQITGLFFGPKMIFIHPPPSDNDFFPIPRLLVILLLLQPFCLNFSLFAFILPFSLPFLFFFPLTSFSIPFLYFSFPFLPFSCTFSPFFSSTFHIFPPDDIGWYSPGRGHFPICSRRLTKRIVAMLLT